MTERYSRGYKKMKKLFNSTFEVSLRLMLLLSIIGDVPMTVDRIAAYDVMTIYSRDVGLSDEVLHGDNEFGLSEFASRRNKAQKALRELVLNGSVKAVISDKGFSYQITPAGKGVTDNMVTQYATDYKRLAKITAARYRSMSDEDIMTVINTTSEEALRR